MSSDEMYREFLVLRYTLVEESQVKLFASPLPKPKGLAVLKALGVNEPDQYFKKNGVQYSFVGFKWAKPTAGYDFPEGRFLSGKVAKLRQTETGEHVPGDIVKHPQDDWVGLFTIIDVQTQHIIIEKNWKFGTPEQIENAFQEGLAKLIFEEFNCRVFVKGRTKEHHFWQIIKGSENVYKLNLKLISPNILEANKKVRKALEDLKNIFVQDEIDLTLKNDAGNLEVPEDPIADYINYIAEGEGSWKVISKLEGKRKCTYSSFENIDTFELPVSTKPEIEPIEPSEGEKEAQIKYKEMRFVAAAFVKLEKYSE